MDKKTETVFSVISLILVIVSGTVRYIYEEHKNNSDLMIKTRVKYSDMSSSYPQTEVSKIKSSNIPKKVTVTAGIVTEEPKTTKEPKTDEVHETTTVYIDSSEPFEEYVYINLNTAETEDFMKLDGIGQKLSERIVNYREENGDFRNIEEIMLVDGIGESIFYKICGYIYVENPVYEEYEEVTEQEYIDEYYEESEEPLQEVTEEITTQSPYPVNINTAEKDELMLLPYVTEEVANEIIELRTRLGGYSNTYELLFLESLEQKQVAEITELTTTE